MDANDNKDIKISEVRRTKNGSKNKLWVELSTDLVVGDILQIYYGDTVPVDCVVLESKNCYCSEAAVTGEPDD